jgi:Ser/Thr protein kinase RdoA (MazF antagonist)
VEACSRFIPALDDVDAWRDEPLSAWVPLLPRVRALWAAREELFSIVAQAPPTVVHCDFWPTNLFVTDTGESVAIDWSQVGIGGVTQDLDQLTLDPVWMQVRPDESLDLLESTVLDGYRAGLAAAGADLDPAVLRRWYAAMASLHYSWLAGGQPHLLGDPDTAAFNQRRFGRDLASVVNRRRDVVERAVSLGEWVLGAAR